MRNVWYSFVFSLLRQKSENSRERSINSSIDWLTVSPVVKLCPPLVWQVAASPDVAPTSAETPVHERRGRFDRTAVARPGGMTGRQQTWRQGRRWRSLDSPRQIHSGQEKTLFSYIFFKNSELLLLVIVKPYSASPWAPRAFSTERCTTTRRSARRTSTSTSETCCWSAKERCWRSAAAAEPKNDRRRSAGCRASMRPRRYHTSLTSHTRLGPSSTQTF